MITLYNGSYSDVGVTLSESLIINGINSGNDLNITDPGGYYYTFKIVNDLTDAEKLFLPDTTVVIGGIIYRVSGDQNAGTGNWVRWNSFNIGVNTTNYSSSDKEWAGEIGLTGPGWYNGDTDTNSTWQYEVWACPQPQPAYGITISIPTNSILLETGRMYLKN